MDQVQGDMWNLALLVVLFLQPPLSNQRALHSLTTPSRGKTTDSNATTLAAGEPCGVYTVRCGHGLRCIPPERDPRPLRALLEGRGMCGNTSNISTTAPRHTLDSVPTEAPDEAPCRKLLTTLIKGFSSQLFKSHHDMYMPSCDKNGFFKKKQCWSSRGRQPGKCWCVDGNGMPLPSNTTQKRSVVC